MSQKTFAIFFVFVYTKIKVKNPHSKRKEHPMNFRTNVLGGGGA